MVSVKTYMTFPERPDVTGSSACGSRSGLGIIGNAPGVESRWQYQLNKQREMKNKTFTTRRADVSFTYGRNQNIVRHQVKGLGTISQGVIVGLLVLIVGLIYVAQGTEATSYDYRLSEINEEIAALEDEKEDLALEKARLTSLASVENNEVAANMQDGAVTGYATE